MMRAVANNMEEARVEELMTRDVVTVKGDTPYRAASLIRERNIRHLVVVDEGIPGWGPQHKGPHV